MANAVTGLMLAAVAGVANATFTLPMKFARQWAWENIWFVWSVLALIALPVGAAVISIPSLQSVYREAGLGTMATIALCGAGWGDRPEAPRGEGRLGDRPPGVPVRQPAGRHTQYSRPGEVRRARPRERRPAEDAAVTNGDGRRATGDGRRATGDGRRANGRRATGDGRRATGDGRGATRATATDQRFAPCSSPSRRSPVARRPTSLPWDPRGDVLPRLLGITGDLSSMRISGRWSTT